MNNSNSRSEYIVRLNAVIDYIEQNLDQNLSLEILADVAHFSKFHFHRLFRALVGETLGHFIFRVRIERAGRDLIANPKKTISEIYYDLGFSGPAVFTRNFRSQFGMSPTQWRNDGYHDFHKKNQIDSNNHQQISKKWQEYTLPPFYIDSQSRNQVWRIKMNKQSDVKVEIKNLPEMHVAYLRHTGPYKGDGALFEKLYTKLCNWAGPRNLLQSAETKFLSVYHDDPEITADENLRLSVCVTIPADMHVDGQMGKMVISGGKYAIGSFSITESAEYQEAWTMMMAGWLPDSGFQPDERLCFELYENSMQTSSSGKHQVDICIPVKPL